MKEWREKWPDCSFDVDKYSDSTPDSDPWRYLKVKAQPFTICEASVVIADVVESALAKGPRMTRNDNRGRNDGGRNDGGRNDGGGRGGRGGREGREGRDNQGRGQAPQDEGWNTVPISTKNRPIDTSRLSKITKVGERTLHLDRNARFQYDFCYFFLPSTI